MNSQHYFPISHFVDRHASRRAGHLPLDPSRETSDDVFRHPQQGRETRVQEVHAGTYDTSHPVLSYTQN